MRFRCLAPYLDWGDTHGIHCRLGENLSVVFLEIKWLLLDIRHQQIKRKNNIRREEWQRTDPNKARCPLGSRFPRSSCTFQDQKPMAILGQPAEENTPAGESDVEVGLWIFTWRQNCLSMIWAWHLWALERFGCLRMMQVMLQRLQLEQSRQGWHTLNIQRGVSLFNIQICSYTIFSQDRTNIFGTCEGSEVVFGRSHLLWAALRSKSSGKSNFRSASTSSPLNLLESTRRS